VKTLLSEISHTRISC